MISFIAAFGLEVLLFNGSWTKVPVGVVLAVMTLLICWCVWTTLEARTSISDGVHALKDGLVDLTRRLRGKASGPGPDVEGAGDG